MQNNLPFLMDVKAVVDFAAAFKSMKVNSLSQRSFTSPFHQPFSLFTNEFAINEINLTLINYADDFSWPSRLAITRQKLVYASWKSVCLKR